MTFADDMDNECPDCLRILNRDGVADSCYIKCYTCPNGVKIRNGKRVFNESSDIPDNKTQIEVVKTDSVDEKKD